jgi:hypothetical protein
LGWGCFGRCVIDDWVPPPEEISRLRGGVQACVPWPRVGLNINKHMMGAAVCVFGGKKRGEEGVACFACFFLPPFFGVIRVSLCVGVLES